LLSNRDHHILVYFEKESPEKLSKPTGNIKSQTHKKDTAQNSNYYSRYIVRDIGHHKIVVVAFNYKTTISW
jgi:hypothetical protein